MFVVPVGPNAAKKFYFYDSESSRVFFSSDGYYAWYIGDNPYAELNVVPMDDGRKSLVATLFNVPSSTGIISSVTKTLGPLLIADKKWISKLKFANPQDDYTYTLWTTDGYNILAIESFTQTDDVSRAWCLSSGQSTPIGLDVRNGQEGAMLGTLFYKPRGHGPIWLKSNQSLKPMATNSLQLAQLGVPRRTTTIARKAWFDMILTISDNIPCTFDMFNTVDEILVSYRNQGQL
jgi:hypothetical protein